MDAPLPLSDRLLRALLRAWPPPVRAADFASAVIERRGEPDEEGARLRAVSERAFGSAAAGDPFPTWIEVVRAFGHRPPETAAAALERLAARWVAPTPLQAEVLRLARCAVEIAEARAAGLSPEAAALLLYALDPARPPVDHPEFARSLPSVGERDPAALATEVTYQAARLPQVTAVVQGVLPHVLAAIGAPAPG